MSFSIDRTRGLGTQDLLKDKREQILTIAIGYKTHNIRVFCSVAKG